MGPGFGLNTWFHWVPVHRSFRVSRPFAAPLNAPTAHACLGDVAATAAKPFQCTPGLGLVTCVQLVPFQCRARVCAYELRVFGWKFPTAHASPRESAATPYREFFRGPGLGLGVRAQRLPFQRRINVWRLWPRTPAYWPTAQTSRGDTALTPF